MYTDKNIANVCKYGGVKMTKGSTLKYIAKELGVSVSTVSRAVNGKTVVNEETRKRVLDAAKKYSYTPNEIARSLQKSTTDTIAIVLPDVSETFFGIIVKEIERVVARKGYMVILSDTHEKPEKEQKYIDMLFKRRVDALVLATVDCKGESVKKFLDNGTPVVFIDNIPELENIDAITINNRKASILAVEYLSSNGHKNIAGIFGSEDETTGAERFAGYKDGLLKCGIKYNSEVVALGDYKLESGYDAMKKLIEKRKINPFTAVYVTSEKMTYGALRAIRDAGLRVPEDLSVIGFDINNLADDRRQMITTIRQPEKEIGKMVGDLLLNRLENADKDTPVKEYSRTLLEPILEKGDTVRKI